MMPKDTAEAQARTPASEAQRFLRALDPLATAFTFQTFDDDAARRKALPKGAKDPLARVLHGALDECWGRLQDLSRRGAGVFVCVNATDLAGRKLENLAEVRAVWAELDRGMPERGFPIEPSILVESSPGKFHAYWIVSGLSADEHLGVIERMVSDHGSDPAAKDLVRVLRLPGFPHQKDPANPWTVRIASMPGRRYSCDEVLAAFPPIARAIVVTAAQVRREPPSLAALRDALAFAPVPDDRDTWRMGIAAIRLAYGEAGYDAADDWSRRSAKYDAGDMRRVWLSHERPAGGRVVTVGTILWWAKHRGWDGFERLAERPAAEDDFGRVEPDDVPSSALARARPITERGLVIRKDRAHDDYANALAAVAQAGLAVAWDELSQRVVFRTDRLPWPASHGRALDDNTCRLVRVMLAQKHQGVDYQPSKENVFEALMTIAYANMFNPVTEYLDGLDWDGVRRVDRLFTDYFNCADDAYVRAVSKCFMVGAVRRARSPGCKLDTMPILDGPQGWNKSTAFKALFGVEFFSDANLGDLRGKDAAMLLRGKWFQEFAELDGMSRADASTMKGFCSRSVDSMRDPYERATKDFPRRCVFGGTVNEAGYLTDGTGNRRFWPLTVLRPIDASGIAGNRDQLWAEASALEAAGEPDVLPSELWALAGERQASQTTEDPWIGIVRQFLSDRAADHATDASKPPPDKVLTRELLSEALGIDPSRQSKGMAQRLRVVMENGLGWKISHSVRVGRQVGAGYKEPRVDDVD